MYDTPPPRRRFAEPLDWAVLASIILHGLVLALRFGTPGGGSAAETTSPDPIQVVLGTTPPPQPSAAPLPQNDNASNAGAPLSTSVTPPGELAVTLLRLPAQEAVAEKPASDATAERKAGRQRSRSPIMTAQRGKWQAKQGEHSEEKQPSALAEAGVGRKNIAVPEDEHSPQDSQPALGNPDTLNNSSLAEAEAAQHEREAAIRAEAQQQAEAVRHKAEEAALAEAAARRQVEVERAEQAAQELRRQTEQAARDKQLAEQAAERQKAEETTRLALARQAAEAAAKKQAEDLARQQEQTRQALAVQLAEQQRAAEQQKAAELARQEQARQAAELAARQQAEAQARAEQQRRLQEQQAAVERQRAEETARAEQARQAAEAARKQAEAATLAEKARQQAALASAAGSGTGNGTGGTTGTSSGTGNNSGAGIALPIAPPAGLSLAERALQQARQGNLYAEKAAPSPRGRVATFSQSAAAAEPELRFYAESWNIKLERIGSLNKPRLSPDRFYRPVTLSIVINGDGTLHSVSVRHSSGDEKLDEAARRIVVSSAPFSPFPGGMRNRYDQIEINRTWDFGAGTTSLSN